MDGIIFWLFGLIEMSDSTPVASGQLSLRLRASAGPLGAAEASRALPQFGRSAPLPRLEV